MNHKRIGLLGGSFDPMHFGHLNMAIALREAHKLDEVVFCPAYTSPFKLDTPPWCSGKHRLAMISCGLQGIDGFSVLDWEVVQESPCYTIDTVKRLKEQSETAELFLLLGEDQLLHLHRWKSVEELFSLCRPLVASRENKGLTLTHLSGSLQLLIDKGRTPIPMMDISSTAVRERLKHKLFCGHLVPALILDYIHRNRLYS
jgi:nicotinate-nucleotide adenylyltransferase